MTIIKRGKSYWIDIGYDRKRIRKRSPDNTYKGAKAYELHIRHKLAHGLPLSEPNSAEKQTFRETALQWLEVYVKNNNKLSEFKNRRYTLTGRIIPYFGSRYIDDIKAYDIEQYKKYLLSEKELSPKTINNYLCIISRCFKSAVEWEILKEVPKIKLLKIPPQKYDYLTEAESELLLKNANGIWHDMILLAVRTGLRFGELIALQWDDINLKEGILVVNRSIVRNIEGSPKNNKTRVMPLSPSIINMLDERNKCGKYIFYDKAGFPLSYDVCRHKLHSICKQSGLRKIGWHTLRHSFASHLTAKRNSIVAIKELMGHSDVKTTMRYAHVNLPILQNAVLSLEQAPTAQ
jgi:integrase